MKIIFSRKGFDNVSGGCPSPIVGKLPISLPTPRERSTTKYSDVEAGNVNLGKVVEDLTHGKVGAGDHCYVNPELDRVGVLGQSGRPQAHLSRNKVGAGDLFLFFDLFREAKNDGDGKLGFVRLKPPHYRLFGWLEVGETKGFPGKEGEKYARIHQRYRKHPHFVGAWEERNAAYFPTQRLSFIPGEDLPGYGRCRADHPMTLLSVGGERPPGTWKMPDWLNPNKGGKGLTFHADRKWQLNTLENAPRAQELIADPHPDRVEEMHDWLRRLFDSRYIW